MNKTKMTEKRKVELKTNLDGLISITVGDTQLFGSGQFGEITEADLKDLLLILNYSKDITLMHSYDNFYYDRNGWEYEQHEKSGPLFLVKTTRPITKWQKIMRFIKKLWR